MSDDVTKLKDFDMQWALGFDGDTFALIGATLLVMGPPAEQTASYDAEQIR